MFDHAGETFVPLEGGDELFCSCKIFGCIDDALASVFGVFAGMDTL